MGRKKKFDQPCRRERYRLADINGKLVMNLRDIQRTMHALYEGRGSVQRALIILGDTEPIAQKALTERLVLQPGTVSGVLGRMEEDGLIRRDPCADDQRTLNVRLTEKGRQEARLAAQQRVERHRQMFACLTEEEKGTLLALLEKVNADWAERYDRE